MLLGVDGVCVISHGSSSAAAIANAVTVAHDLAVGGLVEDVRGLGARTGSRRLRAAGRGRAYRSSRSFAMWVTWISSVPA